MQRALVLAILAILAAPSVPAGSASDAESAPHLLIRLDNTGGERTLADLLVTRDDGERIFEDTIEVPAGGATDVRVDAPEGIYDLELVVSSTLRRTASPTGLLFPEWSRQWVTAASGGCPGAFEVRFALTGGVGTAGRGDGCAVVTAPFAALLAEAQASRAGASLASARVPPPGDADRGVYAFGDADLPFEWRASSTFLDAWGLETMGNELVYRDTSVSAVGGGSLLTPISAEASDTNEALRYRSGEARPLAWTRTLTSFGESAPTAASVQVVREVRFDAHRGSLPCLLRADLQGMTARPGDAIDASAFCDAWDGPAWRAAAPVDHRGLRAIPLYQVEESAERTLVAKLLFADGVPYPLSFERHELPSGGLVRSTRASLEGYEPAGAPLAPRRAPAPEPAPRLAPLDALHGPALADGARLPFALADASDAARANPALRDLQLVLARSDAALVGAHYARVRDDGAPFGTLRWVLAFSAADAGPVYVRCERPEIALPVAPPSACRETLDAPFTAARIGRASLPALSASFDDALARWDATRAQEPGAVATRALYLAPAQLLVGAASAEAMTPMGETASGAADLVALDLATARTLAHVEIVEASTPLVGTPARWGDGGLQAGGSRWVLDVASPYAVGAGVALLLALLGFLLYSRLARARVLDDATRARIHAVVAREPGLHASAILERLGKLNGVGEYHLDVLVRESYLTALATPGFRRYFITGRHTPVQMRALAAMREGQNEKLFAIIRANPGIPLGSLALRAGVSVPYASKSVARLAEAGLVDKVQVGRAVALHALDERALS